jgi:hypothetical protein
LESTGGSQGVSLSFKEGQRLDVFSIVLQLMLKNVARIASNSAILAIDIERNFLRELIADLLVSLLKTVISNLLGLIFARDAVTLRNHVDIMNCFCGNSPEIISREEKKIALTNL